MSKKYIEDFQAGDKISSIFLIKDISLRESKNGNKYMQLILCDRSGEIKAMKWDATTALYERFLNLDFLKAEARVDLFQNKRQLVLAGMTEIDADELDPIDFLPSAKCDLKACLSELQEILARVERPHLKQLLDGYWQDADFMRRFLQAPAAVTLHNAYIGGLLEHTALLVRDVDAFARNHPELDADLLLVGAFLHDLAKIEELTYSKAFQYSEKGNLVGHLVMGVQDLEQRTAAITEFPLSLKHALQHMVLAHHGQHEWGSPTLPSFPEALAVHALDNLLAKTDMMFNEIKPDEVGADWTDRSFIFGTRLWRKRDFGG